MASAGAPASELRRAAFIGLVAGVLADADVFIRSDDPLIALEFHRHFTHALLFVPVGALVATLLCWPLRGGLGFARVYRYAFLGYVLSGVLDACTSYGTRLLWPLSDVRVSWDLVSIVDPLFTLALGLPLVLGLARRRRGVVRIGLGLAAVYLGFAVLQQQRATQALEALATSRGQTVERMLVRPSFGNAVLWRGLYLSDGIITAAAVHVGFGVETYPGATAPAAAAPAHPQLARFAALTGGWLVGYPDQPLRIGDARHAMLPTGIRPIWSLAIRDDGTPELIIDRAMSAEERERFMAMLAGG